MRKVLSIMSVFVFLGIFQFIPTEAEARRSGGGFSSSRSSSRSWSGTRSTSSSSTRNRSSSSSFSKQTPAQKKAAAAKAKADQKARQAKADAKAKKLVEAKKAKALANKDRQAFSKYKTKADAEKAYRASLPKNSYTSKTPPATRPAHIPTNHTVGGKTVNVTYNTYGGGSYGYGYMHPTTGLFTQLLIADMIIDNNRMRQAGYGNWSATGQPIYPPKDSGSSGLSVLFTILLILTGVGIVFWIANRNEYA